MTVRTQSVTGETPTDTRSGAPLQLEHVVCCICGLADSDPVAVGEDFEYRTSPDSFLAVRCRNCSLVYLDPRPTAAEFARIYPDDYHAFSFDEAHYGLAYRVRSRLEARRLLRVTRTLAADAAILDVGCGDGFHLDLLRRHGEPGWSLQGVDLDERAVEAARRRGLSVAHGYLDAVGLPRGTYDLILLIATIEHVGDPIGLLRTVYDLLKPGGRVVVVTDNTDTLDFRISKTRHWGGYHFPRHWNLFDRTSIRALAGRADLEVAEMRTLTSPVNWTYSVRNALADWGAPRRLVECFSLSSPAALAVFTIVDAAHNLFRRGALLQAILQRPA